MMARSKLTAEAGTLGHHHAAAEALTMMARGELAAEAGTLGHHHAAAAARTLLAQDELTTEARTLHLETQTALAGTLLTVALSLRTLGTLEAGLTLRTLRALEAGATLRTLRPATTVEAGLALRAARTAEIGLGGLSSRRHSPFGFHGGVDLLGSRSGLFVDNGRSGLGRRIHLRSGLLSHQRQRSNEGDNVGTFHGDVFVRAEPFALENAPGDKNLRHRHFFIIFTSAHRKRAPHAPRAEVGRCGLRGGQNARADTE